MTWQLIETDAALVELIARHRHYKTVAVDTEFMRRNTFYPKVALVQLCFDDIAWLVDPLGINDATPLISLLTDENVLKVLHSASEDLEVFHHWLGVLPAPLFDTQRAAGLLDIGFGMGYAALVNTLCGIELPKGETRSDWLQRPLTQSQCDYAAQDVTHLMSVWTLLGERCREEGKFDWVLDDAVHAAAGLSNTAGDYYKRVKNAWRLDPRQLAVLVGVSAWRERTARERDKPRNWIIDDAACVALATEQPQNAETLACMNLPAPVLRRHGEELIDVVSAALSQPVAELSPSLPAPLGASQRSALKRLKKQARVLAAELAIAPEMVLPGKDFELLLREAAGESVEAPLHWQGWRKDRIITPLRAQLLAGTV